MYNDDAETINKTYRRFLDNSTDVIKWKRRSSWSDYFQMG